MNLNWQLICVQFSCPHGLLKDYGSCFKSSSILYRLIKFQWFFFFIIGAHCSVCLTSCRSSINVLLCCVIVVIVIAVIVVAVTVVVTFYILVWQSLVSCNYCSAGWESSAALSYQYCSTSLSLSLSLSVCVNVTIVIAWQFGEFQKLCSTAVLCSVVMLLIVIIIIVLSHLIVSMVMVYQLCQFGESQKLRLVRILRSTVMVRVGGGWVALDEFLVKNDPCRGTPSTLPLVRLS